MKMTLKRMWEASREIRSDIKSIQESPALFPSVKKALLDRIELQAGIIRSSAQEAKAQLHQGENRHDQS